MVGIFPELRDNKLCDSYKLELQTSVVPCVQEGKMGGRELVQSVSTTRVFDKRERVRISECTKYYVSRGDSKHGLIHTHTYMGKNNNK